MNDTEVVGTVEISTMSKDHGHQVIGTLRARFEMAVDVSDVHFPILSVSEQLTRAALPGEGHRARSPRGAHVDRDAVSRRTATVRQGGSAVRFGRQARGRSAVGLRMPSGAVAVRATAPAPTGDNRPNRPVVEGVSGRITGTLLSARLAESIRAQT